MYCTVETSLYCSHVVINVSIIVYWLVYTQNGNFSLTSNKFL